MATYRAHTYHDRWIVVARRYYTTLSFTFRRAISIVRDKLSYFRVSKITELLQNPNYTVYETLCTSEVLQCCLSTASNSAFQTFRESYKAKTKIFFNSTEQRAF